MERKGCLMREDSDLIGPEPEDDEVLVLTSWEVDEAVDTSPHAGYLSVFEVLAKELRRIARRGSLLGRKVAHLPLRGGE